MCSEFTTFISAEKIANALGAQFVRAPDHADWSPLVKMHTKAPVVSRTDQGLSLEVKIFPSSPLPNARLSGIGNQSDGHEEEAGDEVQIRRIYDLPRWKDGFKNHPVLIPMANFHEFAYWGDQEGTALSFSIPQTEGFFAAGITFRPWSPKGDNHSAFTILTHTATEQMLQYHHRLVVVLPQDQALTYLEPMSPLERFEFLIENRYTGPLEVQKVRNMAKGWDKRAPAQNRKLDSEKRYREILIKEDVLG